GRVQIRLGCKLESSSDRRKVCRRRSGIGQNGVPPASNAQCPPPEGPHRQTPGFRSSVQTATAHAMQSTIARKAFGRNAAKVAKRRRAESNLLAPASGTRDNRSVIAAFEPPPRGRQQH